MAARDRDLCTHQYLKSLYRDANWVQSHIQSRWWHQVRGLGNGSQYGQSGPEHTFLGQGRM